MRFFVALDIPADIRDRLGRFLEGVRDFAPDVRWVRPESFHITLKFIGEQPAERVEQIKRTLVGVSTPPITVTFRGTGFFPSANSARVFWVGMETDDHLANLAAAVDQATATLGIAAETKPYTPHLTLARGGSGAPHRRSGDRANAAFRRLQEKLAAISPPEFGTMTAREFFLYESKLSPSGARYTKRERFPLGSSSS
jgi:2'-5' RNA ligase